MSAKDVGEDQEDHPPGLGERADFPFIRPGQVEQAVAPETGRARAIAAPLRASGLLAV